MAFDKNINRYISVACRTVFKLAHESVQALDIVEVETHVTFVLITI